MAAHIDQRVRTGEPAFAVYAEERHPDDYRAAAAELRTRHSNLIAPS
jgi:hypothetical protein